MKLTNNVRTRLCTLYRAAAVTLMMGAALPATAGVVYTLNNGGGFLTTPGNYGSVTLTDISGGVQVSVALAGTEFFANTGSGPMFSFNLDATPTSVGNFSRGNGQSFSAFTPGGRANPFGTFTWGISCSTCGSGTSLPIATAPFVFEVMGASLTTADFALTSTAPPRGYTPAYFAADICSGVTDSGCTSTGQVGATGPGTPTNVPEPAALGMMGMALVGTALARKMRRK